MRCRVGLVVIAIALILGVSAYIYSGLYDVSATVPHWDITEEVLEIVRERSIAVRSWFVFLGSTSRPVRPSITASGTPPTFVATTARPQFIASRTACGIPSL